MEDKDKKVVILKDNAVLSELDKVLLEAAEQEKKDKEE